MFTRVQRLSVAALKGYNHTIETTRRAHFTQNCKYYVHVQHYEVRKYGIAYCVSIVLPILY